MATVSEDDLKAAHLAWAALAADLGEAKRLHQQAEREASRLDVAVRNAQIKERQLWTTFADLRAKSPGVVAVEHKPHMTPVATEPS